MRFAIAYCYCLLPQLLLAVQSFSIELKRTGNWRQSNDPPYECSLKDPFDFWSGNYRIIFYNKLKCAHPIARSINLLYNVTHTFAHTNTFGMPPQLPISPIPLAEKRFWSTTDFITLPTSNRISFFFSSFFFFLLFVCMHVYSLLHFSSGLILYPS